LDVTHPGVLSHLQELIKEIVDELGFSYLKLDFLYAGALPGVRYNSHLTRAQGLYQALRVIREAAGEDVDLLGCGCPLGSGIGIFDSMRINPDVAPQWKPSYWGIEGFLEKDEGMPSVRNAILTTINRSAMHGHWWINDPDCLLIRSTETQLSAAEVQTLATVIAMSAGSLIVSDDLPALTEGRIDWLTRLVPPLPKAARAVDWFDTPQPSKLIADLEGPSGRWHLLGLINWNDEPAELVLDLRDFGLEGSNQYHVVNFWRERYKRLSSTLMHFPDIPAHGVCLLAIRPTSKEPVWIGDTLHVSQGLAVKEWRLNQNRIDATLGLGRRASGKAWINLHEKPDIIRIDDQEVKWQVIDQGVIELTLAFREQSYLEISW
jgi:alpha-galactosidase